VYLCEYIYMYIYTRLADEEVEEQAPAESSKPNILEPKTPTKPKTPASRPASKPAPNVVEPEKEVFSVVGVCMFVLSVILRTCMI
jgi:hypothetical protein